MFEQEQIISHEFCRLGSKIPCDDFEDDKIYRMFRVTKTHGNTERVIIHSGINGFTVKKWYELRDKVVRGEIFG